MSGSGREGTIAPPSDYRKEMSLFFRVERRCFAIGRPSLPPVEAGERRLRQCVRIDVEAEHRRRRFVVDVELVGFERKDGDHVAMRLALGRAWAAISGQAEVVVRLDRAVGKSGPAARAFRQRRDGRGNIGDPPVGASGSYMLTAKLFVSFAAPDQESAGDTFLPVQSYPLNTCSSAILAPGLFCSRYFA